MTLLTKWLDSQSDDLQMTWCLLHTQNDVTHKTTLSHDSSLVCLTRWNDDAQNDFTHKMTLLTKWLYSQNDLTHKTTLSHETSLVLLCLTRWNDDTQNDLTHKMTWRTKWLHTQNDFTHKMTWRTISLCVTNQLFSYFVQHTDKVWLTHSLKSFCG